MAELIQYTVSFDEKIKGFSSFHSYIPDWMTGLNNRLYSVSGGQLYMHDDTDNLTRNTFYGTAFNSELITIINENPSDIKVAKAINTESNKAFDITITGYLNDETTSITQSTIAATEFLNKEGKFHGYVRRNELTGDLTAKSAYGLGTVSGVASFVITLNDPVPLSLISIGDDLYDSANLLLGVITAFSGSTITIDAIVAIGGGTFLYGLKNGRIEGSELRGYNFEIKIVDTTTTRTELFALNAEVFKSNPS